MNWSRKAGAWISGPYRLERQRIPLSLTGGYQQYRYEIECDGIWIGHGAYLDDAKRFAEAHAAQVAAGVLAWPPDGFPD